MQFRAIIQRGGKTATGIPVPTEVVTSLGTSKRPAVRATINEYTYRSSVASMGGVFMLPVSAEIRAHTGVADNEVEVELELDTEPRTVVPPDFAEALERDTDAKQYFDGLAFSHKRWFVLSIEEAKTAETRQRRIGKAVSTLHEGRV